MKKEIKKAEKKLTSFYKSRGNIWFTDEWWPEHRYRIIRSIKDASEILESKRKNEVRALDIGAFNGYVSFLLNEVGFQTTACDAVDLEDRRELLDDTSVSFFLTNLNDPNPLSQLSDERFDLVFMGEVFEHILNSPMGLLESVCRVLDDGGYLILTTPNPCNIYNSVRLLIGEDFIHGTEEFFETTKFEDGNITTEPSIHYREYAPKDINKMISRSGLRIIDHSFLSTGYSDRQSHLKFAFKRFTGKMKNYRLFSSIQYILAKKHK